MAYSQEVKTKVRKSFIQGHPLKAAADLNSVPYETVRAWKRNAKATGDDWDSAKAAIRISSSGVQALTAEVIEDFVLLFQTTIEDIKNADIPALQKADAIARLADAYNKTIKAAGASNPELSALSIAMDVLQRQVDFIRKRFPQHVDVFMEILEPFGEELSRVFG